MRKKDLFNLIGMLLVGLLFVGAQARASVPERLPEFSFTDIANGHKITSSDWKGQVVLVNFWATWCPPCIKEIPGLIDLQEKYGKEGFSVVGVSMDQGGAGLVKKMVEKKGINYPVFLAGGGLQQVFGGVYGIPASFLFDQQGNLVKHYPGFVTHDKLEESIKALLH